jgi:hypothetical protein
MKIYITIFIIFLYPFYTSIAQDCDECSRPNIVYYDCDVFVGQPADSLAPIVFYWPFASAIDYLVKNSPGCISWAGAALADVEWLEKGMPNSGPQNLMTAPEGGKKNWDYLIRSTVTGSEGIYRFSMYLEVAVTREQVAGYTIQFSDDIQSAKDAGLAVAAQFSPIMQKIRSFEQNKRDTDTKYAISNIMQQDPREITVTPQKTQVDTGETIDVKIKMVDCDGEVLPNRSIIFVDTSITSSQGTMTLASGTEGGTITPESATTDDEGFVTVQFKAGSVPRIATIVAWYPHLTPTEHQETFMGTALVQIEPPRTDLWLLNANVNYNYTMNSDTSIIFDAGGHSMVEEHSETAEITTNGRIIAVIENFAEDPSKDFSYNTDAADPVAIIVSGSGIMNEYGEYEETIDGKLISADIRSDNVSGYAYPGASIQFDFTDDYKYAGVGVSIKATGQYIGRQFFYEWSDYGGKYDDYSLSSSAGGSPEDGCSITRVDTTGYNALYSKAESSKKANLNGTRYITTNNSLSMSIRPYNPQTLDVKENSQLFPKDLTLSQNYPNPFNPSTTITYQLPKPGKVSLKVYNILGSEIATLINSHQSRGTYSIPFNATSLPSGVYFYHLMFDNNNYVRKMMLVK